MAVCLRLLRKKMTDPIRFPRREGIPLPTNFDFKLL